ncbi:hypothetical protein D3C77_523270 [compost metagenome]
MIKLIEFVVRIEVLIHDFNRQPFRFRSDFPMGVPNSDDFRINGLDRIVKHLVANVILRPEIFVANLNVLQSEGLRMSVQRPQCSPFARQGAIGVFNGIQHVLNPFIEFIDGNELTGPSLASHPAVDDKHHFQAQILRHLQILMIAQSIRGPVMPERPMRNPFCYITHRLLPSVRSFNREPLNKTASRKTEEGRGQSLQHAYKVRTQTVFTLFKRLCRK